jgi:small subunit ribosomal protein S13
MLILGKHIDTDKSISRAVQAIFGINTLGAIKICAQIGIAPHVRLKNLSQTRRDQLTKACRDQIQGDLLRLKQDNVKELISMKHYKGIRHMFGLPCRGQRSRTNASTAKQLALVKSSRKPLRR